MRVYVEMARGTDPEVCVCARACVCACERVRACACVRVRVCARVCARVRVGAPKG
jgi:hypothetical protein